MAIDLNTAEEQRDFGALIPDGTFAIVRMAFKPGGTSLPGLPGDQNLFKTARPPSDAVMLETTFTVLFGPHAKRQIFQNFTVEGGKRDEKGNSIAWGITKRFLRAAVESALAINPKDETPEARAKRNVPSISAMNGLEFAVRIGIEIDPSGRYDPKNQIAHVVTPDEPEWALLKQGQIPEPRPSGTRSRASAPAPVEQKPAWQQAAAPAQAALPGAAPAWQQQAAQPPAQPPAQAWPAAPAQPSQPQQTPAPVKGPSWLTS